jgi:hypothetical protein
MLKIGSRLPSRMSAKPSRRIAVFDGFPRRNPVIAT